MLFRKNKLPNMKKSMAKCSKSKKAAEVRLLSNYLNCVPFFTFNNLQIRLFLIAISGSQGRLDTKPHLTVTL